MRVAVGLAPPQSQAQRVRAGDLRSWGQGTLDRWGRAVAWSGALWGDPPPHPVRRVQISQGGRQQSSLALRPMPPEVAARAGTILLGDLCLLSPGQQVPSAQTSETVSVEFSSRVVLMRYSWARVSFLCWAERPGGGPGWARGEAPEGSSL